MENQENDWNLVQYKMEAEGLDYCFRDYSHFDEIIDAKFHELRVAYIAIANELETYVNNKYDETIQ